MFKSANPNRLIIRGIISVAIGVAVIAVPDLTLVNVIKVLGVLMVVDGLVALLINYFSKKKQTSIFQVIPRGTSNLIFGGVLLLFPALMVNVFVFLIGFILLFAGFTQFASQISGRSLIGTSWLLILISIIAFVTGIIFLTKPFESAQTMMIVFGIILALYGMGEVVWSFKIRKAQKQNPPKGPDVIDADYEEIS